MQPRLELVRGAGYGNSPAAVGARFEILQYRGVHADDFAFESAAQNCAGRHIARARFTAEMNYLKSNRPIVSMRQVAAALREDVELPDGAVAVTFDMGYRTTFTEALPVLRKAGIPATVYLATGYVGTGRRQWADQLEDAVVRTTARRLTVEGDGLRIDAALADDDDRARAVLALTAMCERASESLRAEIVDRVCLQLDVAPSSNELYDFCDWDEVRSMAFSGLVDIGAQTVDHLTLTRCGAGTAAAQIRWSVAAVADALADDCELFACPGDQPDDVDELTSACLLSHGIDHAVTSAPGFNRVGITDPFHLRRIAAGYQGTPFPW